MEKQQCLFVREFFSPDLSFRGNYMKNIYAVYLFFLETVRNSANFLLMSAIPETSSMTIRRSIEVFSLKPELLSLVSISLVLNLNFSINLRVLLPDETQLRY